MTVKIVIVDSQVGFVLILGEKVMKLVILDNTICVVIQKYTIAQVFVD